MSSKWYYDHLLFQKSDERKFDNVCFIVLVVEQLLRNEIRWVAMKGQLKYNMPLPPTLNPTLNLTDTVKKNNVK